MATDVVMPQMGESIFEGTVTKWLKRPGQAVERDEPLFEISTDKVDAEIPSPVSGTLQEIKAEAGATVQVNTVVAVIGDRNGNHSAERSSPAAQEPEKPSEAAMVAVMMPQMGESIFEGTITKWLKSVGDRVERDEPLFEISTDKVDAEIPAPAAGVLREIKAEAGAVVQVNTAVAIIASDVSAPAALPTPQKPDTAEKGSPVPSASSTLAARVVESADETSLRSSPLVRKMAREHNLDLKRITGTGSAGRVTKDDILTHLNESEIQKPQAASMAPVTPALPAQPAKTAPTAASVVGQLVPMTKMRSIIAQRMVESKRTNAHVHTVFKVDLTKIVRLREKEKQKYEQRNGVKLTYMPFIATAVAAALRKMPILNASIEGDAIRYHSNINLGIAVALDWGLIVPVIKQVEERSFLGVARAIADVAERARTKKLKPDEVGTSTFTLTNAGIYGEEFGTPIINMPESAILGIGGLTKEPVVITDETGADSIAIRSIIHLTLGFDHRTIDGADAGKFMAEVKRTLEQWQVDIG